MRGLCENNSGGNTASEIYKIKVYAVIAQSVERAPFKRVVLGSNPSNGIFEFFFSKFIKVKEPLAQLVERVKPGFKSQ